METIDHAALFTTSLPKHLTGGGPTPERVGLWRHVKEAASQAAHKDRPNPRTPAVRGARAATDSLLSLCLTAVPAKKWTVFVHPSLREQADSMIKEHSLQPRVGAASVPALTSDLLPDIDVWFDPAGATRASVLLRQCFGQAAYPIAAVQHTMSLHNLLSDYFLPIVSSATYPWDSLVCSTKSSAIAVSRLLCRLRDSSEQRDTTIGFRGRIDVIPLPVDTNYFSPGDKQYSRSLLGLDRRAFLILYLGSLSATKADLVPFLAAFKDLVAESRGTKVKWIIAGPSDARYLAYLKQQVRLIGLLDNVTFLGHVSESEKLNLYRAADVFFSPSDSLQESFGLTPVEAMACGLPQIVSDWNGYRETVIHGATGFRIKTLWAPCDSELRTSGFSLGSDHDHIALGQSVALDLHEWSTATKDLLGSPSLRESMSSRSRSTAVSLYSYSAIAEQHRALWSELIGLHKAAPAAFVPNHNTIHAARYFECFSHYATDLITECEQIKLAKPPRWPARHLQDAAEFVNKDSCLIDLEICTQIIDKLSASNCDLVGIHQQASNARWLRHLLWLMKQGFVERA